MARKSVVRESEWEMLGFGLPEIPTKQKVGTRSRSRIGAKAAKNGPASRNRKSRFGKMGAEREVFMTPVEMRILELRNALERMLRAFDPLHPDYGYESEAAAIEQANEALASQTPQVEKKDG